MPLGPSTASEWPYNPLSTWFIPVNIVPFVSNRHSAMRHEATTVAVAAVARLTFGICHSRATAEGERGQKKMTLL